MRTFAWVYDMMLNVKCVHLSERVPGLLKRPSCVGRASHVMLVLVLVKEVQFCVCVVAEKARVEDLHRNRPADLRH